MNHSIHIKRKPGKPSWRLYAVKGQEAASLSEIEDDFYENGQEEEAASDASEQAPVILKCGILEETGIVRHAFSTRLGGVSKGVFASMDLSYARGDEKAAVDENFRRMAEILKSDGKDMVFSDQTHTVNVRTVTEADRGKGTVREKDYTDMDGLVTNVRGIVLTTFYADCVPLYFVDPKRRAIGLAHSGWRGTAGRMGKRMVKRMREEFGSDPQSMIAAVGPSICGDCYEVGEDVADEFRRAFGGEQLADILETKSNGKYRLDLWKANEWILRDAGLLRENIALPNLCTCCNPGLFFSHRALGGERGSLAAFLALK